MLPFVNPQHFHTSGHIALLTTACVVRMDKYVANPDCACGKGVKRFDADMHDNHLSAVALSSPWGPHGLIKHDSRVPLYIAVIYPTRVPGRAVVIVSFFSGDGFIDRFLTTRILASRRTDSSPHDLIEPNTPHPPSQFNGVSDPQRRAGAPGG